MAIIITPRARPVFTRDTGTAESARGSHSAPGRFHSSAARLLLARGARASAETLAGFTRTKCHAGDCAAAAARNRCREKRDWITLNGFYTRGALCDTFM